MALNSVPNQFLDDDGKLTDQTRRWLNNLYTSVSGNTEGKAPNDSTYIIRTTDTSLGNAQVLGDLTTGFLKVNTGTGTLTSTGMDTIQASDLANTSVTAGSYGAATKTLIATVDAQGRLTALSATNITNITGNASTVTTNANLSGDVSSSGNTTTIGAGKVTEAMQVLADNTTQNVSTSKHGYAPKAPNDATKYLDGTGVYSTPASSGGTALPGVTDGSNASSGNLGEVVSSSVLLASAVSCTTNVVRNVTSISLTAGDWDVYGNITFNNSGIAQFVIAWCSITSATAPDDSLYNVNSAVTTGGEISSICPFLRVSVSSTTTVYLSCDARFSTGTVTACGSIQARRAR